MRSKLEFQGAALVDQSCFDALGYYYREAAGFKEELVVEYEAPDFRIMAASIELTFNKIRKLAKRSIWDIPEDRADAMLGAWHAAKTLGGRMFTYKADATVSGKPDDTRWRVCASAQPLSPDECQDQRPGNASTLSRRRPRKISRLRPPGKAQRARHRLLRSTLMQPVPTPSAWA